MRSMTLGVLVASLLMLPTPVLAESSVQLTTQEDRIPVQSHDANSCVPWENCLLLDGVSLVNIDIADEMDEAYDEMQDHHGDDWSVKAELRNQGLTFAHSYLIMCQYREDHSFIGCDSLRPGLWGDYLYTTIDKDADHLRVILVDGVDAELYLRLTATTH